MPRSAARPARWPAGGRRRIIGEQVSKKFVSRNQLLNEPADVYQEKNADRTDILHEYFIPPNQVAAFLERARAIIPRHPCDLLNVTIRNVLEDKDAFLRYADRSMFAFVMLFNQPRTAAADAEMEAVTQELIDAAIACERPLLPSLSPARHEGTTAQSLSADRRVLPAKTSA